MRTFTYTRKVNHFANSELAVRKKISEEAKIASDKQAVSEITVLFCEGSCQVGAVSFFNFAWGEESKSRGFWGIESRAAGTCGSAREARSAPL